MALPEPQEKESKRQWIDRCMMDDEMREEFIEPDSRLAICEFLWDSKEEQ